MTDTATIAPINSNNYDARTPSRSSEHNWTTLPPMTFPTTSPARMTAAGRPEPARSKSAYSVEIDQIRYWVGGLLTAAIAALLGVVGLVVAHGIIHVPVLLGSGHPVNSVLYGLAVAGIAIGAAALFVGMLHVAPRPVAYYSWLAAMSTALATLLPFTTSAGLHSQIVFAATNLAVGVAIMVLIPMAAVNARR